MTQRNKHAAQAAMHGRKDWDGLIKTILPDVRSLARQIIRRSNKYRYDDRGDAIQEACAAILKLLPRWNPSTASLWTYVKQRARGAMIDPRRKEAERKTSLSETAKGHGSALTARTETPSPDYNKRNPFSGIPDRFEDAKAALEDADAITEFLITPEREFLSDFTTRGRVRPSHRVMSDPEAQTAEVQPGFSPWIKAIDDFVWDLPAPWRMTARDRAVIGAAWLSRNRWKPDAPEWAAFRRFFRISRGQLDDVQAEAYRHIVSVVEPYTPPKRKRGRPRKSKRSTR